MICDQIKNIDKYQMLNKHSDKIVNFINELDLDHLKCGKYFIDSTELYAIVTEYDTMPYENTKTETHDVYYDLVVLLEGEEKMYVDFRDNYKVKIPYNSTNDITFYEQKEEKISIKLLPCMFVFFTPNDIHHPYNQSDTISHIKKVTFKIKINEESNFI